MHNRQLLWINATLDLADEEFGSGKAFWAEVTGCRPNLPPSNNPNFAVLQPADATAHIWLQRLWDDEPRVHLDLSVADLGAAVEGATAAGAEVLSGAGHPVLVSPAGLLLCLLPGPAPDGSAAEPLTSPEGASRVERLHLRVPQPAWEAERLLWEALLGEPDPAGQRPAAGSGQLHWSGLGRSPWAITLHGESRASATVELGVVCSNVPATVARWQQAGARRLAGATVTGEPRVETPGGLVVQFETS